MEKNVKVVDENNRSFGSTYPRRAKHLVKKGRARWSGDNEIALIRAQEISNESAWPREMRVDMNENQISGILDEMSILSKHIFTNDKSFEMVVGMIHECDEDDHIKAQVLKDIALRILESREKIFSHIEGIVRCLAGDRMPPHGLGDMPHHVPPVPHPHHMPPRGERSCGYEVPHMRVHHSSCDMPGSPPPRTASDNG